MINPKDTNTEEKKCGCICHNIKLKDSTMVVKHDTECCLEMNGIIEKDIPTEKKCCEECADHPNKILTCKGKCICHTQEDKGWEKEFDEKFLGFLQAKDKANNTSVNTVFATDIKYFIRSLLTSSQNEMIKKIENTQVKLCREFANTPLNKRKSGWDWILRFRDEVLQIITK